MAGTWITRKMTLEEYLNYDDGTEYQEQRFQADRAIASPTFPDLNLTAAQVLRAGK